MERQQVPIELVYGRHSPEDAPLLTLLKDKIEELLVNRPGRVGVFLEVADFTNDESMIVSAFSFAGYSPSDSFASLLLSTEDNPIPSHEVLEARKSEIIAEYNPFLQSEFEVLDELYEKYDKRVVLFPEGNLASVIENNTSGEGVFHSVVAGESALEIAFSGEFDQALPFYRKAIVSGATQLAERDENISRFIDGVTDFDEMAGITGYIGAGHTGVSERLRQKGQRVRSTFAGKVGRTYYHDAPTAAMRYLARYPDQEMSDEQVLLNMTQNMIGIIVTGMSEGLFQEQEVLKNVWSATQAFKTEDIRAIEQAIKDEDSDAFMHVIYSKVK